MVSGSLSLPLSGSFSPFPHGTRSLSVSSEYLALPDGPGCFTQNSSCSALLRCAVCSLGLRVRASHPLRTVFPDCSARLRNAVTGVLLPRTRVATTAVWAPPRSLATTWGIINLFSLPPGTKMFQFPGLAPRFKRGARLPAVRVVPFGYPRIKGHLHLRAASRSLSRPSSPGRA
jgi:hypothetical protein